MDESGSNWNNIDEDDLARLDGSIKKNTSFIKKLRTITADQVSALTKELLGLKLQKYLSEVVAAIAEAKLAKPADVFAAVEICSLIHQRFTQIPELLAPILQKGLGPPPNVAGLAPEQRDREEAVRIARQRSWLRFYTELYLINVITDKPNSEPSLGIIIRDMVRGLGGHRITLRSLLIVRLGVDIK